MTYNQILTGIDDALTKQAFIPSPTSQQTAPQGQAQGGQDMAQLSQQLQQGGGAGMEGQQPMDGGQGQPGQDPSQQGQQQQDPSQQGQPGQDPSQQGQPQQDPNAPPGGDLSPKGMPQSLKNTAVTVTVADLLDLVSGGKASQAHLKTESMKVQHGFKHKKMLRDEQRKEQEEQQKQQQDAMMQQQQQQGMMGGGIYGGGAMDGSQPGQGQQPQQPQQPGM